MEITTRLAEKRGKSPQVNITDNVFWVNIVVLRQFSFWHILVHGVFFLLKFKKNCCSNIETALGKTFTQISISSFLKSDFVLIEGFLWLLRISRFFSRVIYGLHFLWWWYLFALLLVIYCYKLKKEAVSSGMI